MVIVASIELSCECGSIASANVGDSLHNNILRWHLSYHCKRCGKAYEVDGTDEIPEYVKEAIIDQDGLWALSLTIRKDLPKIIYKAKKQSKFLFTSDNLE